jgi:very-short-patch-repair endonuclease
MKRTSEERKQFVERAAARMVANPTGAEDAAWRILEPLGFKRQVIVEGTTKNDGKWTYILDFARLVRRQRYWGTWHDVGICVEVDGASHQRKKGRDRRRDTRLAAEGIRTLRFTNSDVLKNRIENEIQAVIREMCL